MCSLYAAGLPLVFVSLMLIGGIWYYYSEQVTSKSAHYSH